MSTQETQQIIQVSLNPGKTSVHNVTSGSIVQLDFDTQGVLFERQGEDLVLTNAADGAVVILKGYVDAAPQIQLFDGVLVAGDVFLVSMTEGDTAGDSVLGSGGLNPLFTDSGELSGGIQSEGGGDTPDPQVGMGGSPNPSPDAEPQLVGPTGDAGDTGPAEVAYEYPVVAEGDSVFFDHFSIYFTHQRASGSHVADENDARPWFIEGADVADDVIGGGAANDFLYGYGGNDTISGNGDTDLIIGGSGNDVLNGGTGNDWLDGGTGNDFIYGGGGYDTITMGGDDDVVVFNNSTFGDGSAIVVMNDFTLGEDGVQLADGVEFEALRDYGTHVEAVLGNGSDDNVIVRLMGLEKADFDAHIDAQGDAYAYSDTEQLLQYMAGNESAWV